MWLMLRSYCQTNIIAIKSSYHDNSHSHRILELKNNWYEINISLAFDSGHDCVLYYVRCGRKKLQTKGIALETEQHKSDELVLSPFLLALSPYFCRCFFFSLHFNHFAMEFVGKIVTFTIIMNVLVHKAIAFELIWAMGMWTWFIFIYTDLCCAWAVFDYFFFHYFAPSMTLFFLQNAKEQSAFDNRNWTWNGRRIWSNNQNK